MMNMRIRNTQNLEWALSPQEDELVQALDELTSKVRAQSWMNWLDEFAGKVQALDELASKVRAELDEFAGKVRAE